MRAIDTAAFRTILEPNAEYDFQGGQTPSHCGVDAAQVLKTPSGWPA